MDLKVEEKGKRSKTIPQRTKEEIEMVDDKEEAMAVGAMKEDPKVSPNWLNKVEKIVKEVVQAEVEAEVGH